MTPAFPRALALVVVAGHLAACSTLLAVRGQQQRAAVTAIVSGTVSTTHVARGPLIVGLLARGTSGETFLLDHFVAEKPGPWAFAVAPGKYWLGAFEDANHDQRYENEPALRPTHATEIELSAGQRLQDVDLRIPFEGRFIRTQFALADLRARSSEDQQRVSAFNLSVAGQVTTLDDPRFERKVATDGMWKFWDFLLKTQPGIYFLEEYDEDKIPVLFVHGMGGTPREFRAMIATLDRTRFQPWVFYYPSGMHLEYSAALLTQLFVRLRVQYGFEQAAIVAHSMGGLVTREFVLQDYEASGTKVVQTFVTVASPLGGLESAGKGVERSPIVLYAWEGLAPGSPFLQGLFYANAERTKRRTLPKHTSYHLMFGFQAGEASDGVVALSSQLRPEAQAEARSQRGFEEGHRTILKSAAVGARVNEILAEMP